MTELSAVREGGAVRKVVINACFGGFSLSPAAVRRIAEMDGRLCYFFVNSRTPEGGFDLHRRKRVTEAEANSAFMWSAFDVPNPDEVLQEGDWHAMTQEQHEEQNARYAAHALQEREIPRDDPRLIRVVEELGEAANGSHAKLRIVEIPADADWFIDEYDGNEHVAERHRTWR